MVVAVTTVKAEKDEQQVAVTKLENCRPDVAQKQPSSIHIIPQFTPVAGQPEQSGIPYESQSTIMHPPLLLQEPKLEPHSLLQQQPQHIQVPTPYTSPTFISYQPLMPPPPQHSHELIPQMVSPPMLSQYSAIRSTFPDLQLLQQFGELPDDSCSPPPSPGPQYSAPSSPAEPTTIIQLPLPPPPQPQQLPPPPRQNKAAARTPKLTQTGKPKKPRAPKPRNVLCPQCDFKFYDRYALKRHMIQEHHANFSEFFRNYLLLCMYITYILCYIFLVQQMQIPEIL